MFGVTYFYIFFKSELLQYKEALSSSEFTSEEAGPDRVPHGTDSSRLSQGPKPKQVPPLFT